jgi:hypothetical protein
MSKKYRLLYSAEQAIWFFMSCLAFTISIKTRSSARLSATFFLVVAILLLLWVLNEAIGRLLLVRSIRYKSSYGLLVVGDKVLTPEYVDKKVAEIVEWCADHHFATEVQVLQAIDGVVIECVSNPVNWQLQRCPWWTLPWDDGMWIRVQAFPKCENLPVEIMHRLLFSLSKIENPQLRNIEIERLQFDVPA